MCGYNIQGKFWCKICETYALVLDVDGCKVCVGVSYVQVQGKCGCYYVLAQSKW